MKTLLLDWYQVSRALRLMPSTVCMNRPMKSLSVWRSTTGVFGCVSVNNNFICKKFYKYNTSHTSSSENQHYNISLLNQKSHSTKSVRTTHYTTRPERHAKLSTKSVLNQYWISTKSVLTQTWPKQTQRHCYPYVTRVLWEWKHQKMGEKYRSIFGHDSFYPLKLTNLSLSASFTNSLFHSLTHSLT